MTDWIVRRWARYGHERLYAETPGGTALGYLDLKTGRYHSDDLTNLPLLERAIHEHQLALAAAVPVSPLEDRQGCAFNGPGAMPMRDVTLSDTKTWRRSLDLKTASSNPSAYRLLRSILQAAEEEDPVDRAPPKIRGAGSAPVKAVVVPASFVEIAVNISEMPERLTLAHRAGSLRRFREGELLELRRSDIDGVTGRITVMRKVDKDVNPSVRGACPQCGRHISPPKAKSGVRTVHVPPPFLPMLRRHLLEDTGAGPRGLLFPGDRTDHMSVRDLMDRYRPAREAAGRPDLTIHHLRHTALTLAGQHGATAAELQARAGHASQAAMEISQYATLDRDRSLAENMARRTKLGARVDRSLKRRLRSGCPSSRSYPCCRVGAPV